MCDSCAARAAKLQRLIDQFETMAAHEPDRLTASRLRRAIDDLRASAALEADPCATCSDVIWDDNSAALEAAMG